MRKHTYRFEVILSDADGVRICIKYPHETVRWYKDKMIDVMNFYQCDFQNFAIEFRYNNLYQFTFMTEQDDVNHIVLDMIQPDQSDLPLLIGGKVYYQEAYLV